MFKCTIRTHSSINYCVNEEKKRIFAKKYRHINTRKILTIKNITGDSPAIFN